ncbi:hypothetical protein Taro_039049 [Colocasia esculenta]|uniref:Uncharacterized protein n=1 Tax=Colocasia esculenta TaxID=4460 RepID=A0A843W9N1_COLES|nr:hypothetical protein [Colocasia esculenta]
MSIAPRHLSTDAHSESFNRTSRLLELGTLLIPVDSSCTSLPRGMPQAPVLSCTFIEIWLCKSCTLYMIWCVPLCFHGRMIFLARLRPVRGRRTQIKFVSGLTGLNEAFRHSLYQSKVRKFEMADRRDWGGGGEDPEESTQRMIERIWESLTDIRMRMD